MAIKNFRKSELDGMLRKAVKHAISNGLDPKAWAVKSIIDVCKMQGAQLSKEEKAYLYANVDMVINSYNNIEEAEIVGVAKDPGATIKVEEEPKNTDENIINNFMNQFEEIDGKQLTKAGLKTFGNVFRSIVRETVNEFEKETTKNNTDPGKARVNRIVFSALKSIL